MVTASEVPEDREFDTATLKSLTGGDAITVHEKYGRPFEMQPTFKLWLAANSLPRWRRTDDAGRARVLVVPFLKRFEIPDEGLREHLQSDEPRAALLAFAMRGLREYLEHGLGSCEAVERATTGYWDGRESASREDRLLEEFVGSRIMADPNAITSARDLMDALGALAQELELPCPGASRLAAALRARGYRDQRTATTRSWRGLRLVLRPAGVNDRVTQ